MGIRRSMVTAKVYKKCSQNGQLYLYLGQRDFISSDGLIDDINGIAYMPDLDQFQGKHVFASLVVVYRYGRQEDELIPGLSFMKEMVCDRVQVYPEYQGEEISKFQSKLIEKFGDGKAKPFSLGFPLSTPNSVLIKGDEEDFTRDEIAQMGVSYEVRLQVGDSADRFDQIQIGLQKASVRMVIRKSQYTLDNGTLKKPSIKAEKDFIFSKGKLGLECGTEKEVFYHGQEIPINIAIKNGGNKSVKLIELSIIQHCEMTMVCQKHSCKVAQLQIQDECPISPGVNFNKTFHMKPLAQICDQGRGLALDAVLSREKDEANLASSSLPETDDPLDLLGVIVSYTVRIKLKFSGFARKLEVEVPFKLNHPKPRSEEADNLEEMKEITAKQQAKLAKKRKRFGGQDSYDVEQFGNSVEDCSTSS